MDKVSKLVITLLIMAILMLLSFIIYIKVNQENIFFTLYGSKEIEIYEGSKYKELGFVAIDEDNNNINDRVVIESDLNSNVVGNYTINYSIKTKLKTITLTRTIKVLKDPFKNVEFTLKGNEIENIILYEDYNDSLFTCFDKVTNQEYKSLVQIENNVNNKQIGTYEISYILKLDNKTKTLTRTVNVLKSKYDIVLSNTNLTNEDITINFTSNIPNLNHIITPDEKIVKEKNINYTVKENGTYKFTVYDNQNNFEEYEIKIDNIDKEPPIVKSCNSVIENNQTTFTIEIASDDILKYTIDNKTLNNNVISEEIENGNLVVYDKANNTTKFKCNSYYKEINPKGNENIIENSNTETLKVWIEKIERKNRTDYYVTHIWASDAYNQFKMQVPNNFGKELLTAKQLFNNTISQNNLNNKLAVAVNASGFIKKGVWGNNFYEANNNWNLTGGSPLVIVNGKILRDFSNSTFPSTSYVTYGLKKDGNLDYYKYKKGTNLQENINLSKKIINDGVLNTFSFSPVLVYNNQKKATDTTQNIRQGFCQIDKNNFVFITDIYNSSRNGFSYSELANYMLSLGCKTGFNLDGGGSTSLIFKDKNDSSKTITGNTRAIADILYFHE